MPEQPPRPHEAANTGAEDFPPGATRKAQNRRRNRPARGPNDPTGDPAYDKTPTIDKPPMGKSDSARGK
jgi:hypothetical protein